MIDKRQAIERLNGGWMACDKFERAGGPLQPVKRMFLRLRQRVSFDEQQSDLMIPLICTKVIDSETKYLIL